MSLFEELKRRNVFRVGIAYLVLAWIVIQAADVIFPILQFPDWTISFVAVLAVLGFPLALFLAWAFELTPEGLKREHEVDRSKSVSTGRKLDFVIIGMLVLALGYFVWDKFGAGPGDFQEIVQSSSAVGDINVNTPVPGFSGRAAIAVLPFVNLSGDADQEYFADGLTEDIITGLQTYRGFPVIARTSTFAYRGVAKDVRQIARELGVGYIVEGSVRKSGDKIRIAAQLIDAGGRHLWAKNYDFFLAGLMAVEDEITGQIVNAIEPELLLAETRRVRSVRSEDLEALDYYLRALAESTILFGYSDLRGQPVTLERNDLARQLALKAIEIDPLLSRAYALISHIESEMTHMYRAEITDEEAAVAIERAIRFGTKARQISPFDSTACSCLAFVLLNIGDVALALDIQKGAVAANPSHSNARAVYAWALLFDGQNEAAFEEIQLAKRLSPRDMAMSFYLTTEAAIHLALGDLEMAAIRLREATSMSSFNYDARILHILMLDAMGRKDEARAVLSAFLVETPNFMVKSLWNAPVADVLLGEAAASLSADERPGFHEFVAERLTRLGWQN